MSKITINDVIIDGINNNVIISDNKVIINGLDVTPDSKIINISIEGDINTLSVDSCRKIDVIGNIGSIKTTSGDVSIEGYINGSIQTMSGDVKCGGSVNGGVTTMSGDILYYKDDF